MSCNKRASFLQKSSEIPIFVLFNTVYLDDELNEAIAAKNEIKADLVKSNENWKSKVHGLRKEISEGKAKYDKLKKEHYELNKRTNGTTSRSGAKNNSFIIK